MITKKVLHTDPPYHMWLIYFEHKGASANIAIPLDDPNLAHLYDLFSTNRKKGEASELLREIDEYCREHKLFLEIRAETYDTGEDGIQTNDELASWYTKNGATFVGYDEYEGHPMLCMGFLK